MVVKAGEGHIPSAYSTIELLAVLYSKILSIDPKNPRDPGRDRFILSKGHGCAALYSILAEKGFFSKDELSKYCRPGGILGGHPEMQKIPGVEVSTGSLGHGFPIGIGMALAAKLDDKSYRTFCIVGDGECNEGSIWEGAMSGAHFNLDNITVIVDNNGQQASGDVLEVMNPLDLVEKWRAFGWETVEIDGHSIKEIDRVLSSVPLAKDKPTAVIAHTVKGKGVSFMENQRKWHTMVPNQEEFLLAMKELSSK